MPTLETQQLDKVIATSRRRMLTLGGAALAGLALTSLADAQSTLTDTDYLNFALNLEFLEANFYTLAATGQTIDQAGLSVKGAGNQGTVVAKGGNNYKSCQVPFKNPLIQGYANELAGEERNHVSFLQSALGSAAVAQPQIDLYNGFNTFISFAGIGLATFDPFADDASFLLGAYIFEDVGVTAYTGAIPLLTSNTNLDDAVGLQAAEAYHAGLIRTALTFLDENVNDIAGIGYFDEPPGVISNVATAISALRATLDGSYSYITRNGSDDVGLGSQGVALNGPGYGYAASTIVNGTTTNASSYPSANTDSLIISRTPAQVLDILYLELANSKAFFPAGLNGNIK